MHLPPVGRIVGNRQAARLRMGEQLAAGPAARAFGQFEEQFGGGQRQAGEQQEGEGDRAAHGRILEVVAGGVAAVFMGPQAADDGIPLPAAPVAG
ncbi:hypothetical protein ACFS3C_11910 [Azotobacter vinelandii]